MTSNVAAFSYRIVAFADLPIVVKPPQAVAFFFSPRFMLGYYAADGGKNNAPKKKTLFPDRSVQVLNEDGTFTERWYRAFKFIYDEKLGGDLAPTVPQIASSAQAAQDGLTVTVGAIANVTQTVEANAVTAAESIEAIQVLQTAPAAPVGSPPSVPPVVITPPVLTVPPPPPTPTRPTEFLL